MPTSNLLIERIARQLTLFASFIPNIGLYHGKMGIAISLAHFARLTGNMLYGDCAGELLDEIYEDISVETLIDFESGLCGIGWGIEYLLQNEFIQGDFQAILSSLDRKIMERNIRCITDLSLRTGLCGISCYIQQRIQSSYRNRQALPFDEIYLNDWKSVVNPTEVLDETQLFSAILESIPEGEDISSWKLGLSNGCAGYILKNIRS
jgi:lantibiotic modifying enzyme